MFFIFLSFLSGLLFVLSYEYLKIPFLLFVAFVPLIYVVLKEKKLLKVILYSWIAGLTNNLIGFFWVAHSVKEFGELSSLISYIVLFLFSSLTFWSFVLFSISVYFLKKYYKNYFFYFVLIPASYCVAEFIDFKIFPMNAGTILLLSKYFPQFADVFGALGLSFIILLVNSSLYIILENILNKNKKFIIPTLVITASILFLFFYGYYKNNFYEEVKNKSIKINATIVQGNVGNSLKLEVGKALKFAKELNMDASRTGSSDLILEKYISMSKEAFIKYPDTKLIVWPETAFPGFFIKNDKLSDKLLNYTSSINIPFFVGAYYTDNYNNGYFENYYNSIVQIREDLNIDYYHKNKLLPFSETMPLANIFTKLKGIVSAMGDFARGTGAKVFSQNIDGVNLKIAPLICYEILLSSYIREFLKLDPALIINVTNDSWFGTREPYNHLLASRLISVEFRRPIIRATNTGISAFIDVLGNVNKRSKIFDEDIINEDIYLVDPKIKTFYYHVGYLFPYFLIILLIASYIRVRGKND